MPHFLARVSTIVFIDQISFVIRARRGESEEPQRLLSDDLPTSRRI